MKLLITGGAGFLGHHLIQHFQKVYRDAGGVDIVVLDKLTYASSGLDRLREIGAFEPGSRVSVIGCDLSQPIPEGVAREVGDVDYVIHAAAETHVDRSIIDPMPFIQSNVLGTHHLLWWLRQVETRPSRIFLMSTDEVYGSASWDHPGNVPSDPFLPTNPYSASKASAECFAMAYANTYKLPITVIAAMNLIGERQMAEKMVPLCIRKVLLGEEITIHAAEGNQRSGTRHYLHCRNLASAIQFLIANESLSGIKKIHVSGEREISNLDLAQTIAAVVGKPLCYRMHDQPEERPGHDLRYALDGSAIHALGWRQPVDIDQALERTVRWYLEHRSWLML